MRRIVLGLCLLIGLLAGCASPGTRAPEKEGLRWGTSQADVTAVRRMPGEPRLVRLTVELLAGAEGCSRNPAIGYHTEENGLIYATVTQETSRSDEVGVCVRRTPGEVVLSSRTPIGSRRLVLNQQAWKPVADGYERCSETMGCDPPPADHCDPFWIRLTVRGMDVSRHSTGHKEACADPWLVMTVPDDPAVCGAVPRGGCDATTTTRRYFLRFIGEGWDILARATGPGCAGAPAEFPRRLCEDLPAPG